ncbi:hypothetical protein DFH09DRAFT_262293 [Mycena vulgaris]|nr:hypothetical protein DFH09DRAFT_262293 [Mycena vulgaris]
MSFRETRITRTPLTPPAPLHPSRTPVSPSHSRAILALLTIRGGICAAHAGETARAPAVRQSIPTVLGSSATAARLHILSFAVNAEECLREVTCIFLARSTPCSSRSRFIIRGWFNIWTFVTLRQGLLGMVGPPWGHQGVWRVEQDLRPSLPIPSEYLPVCVSRPGQLPRRA